MPKARRRATGDQWPSGRLGAATAAARGSAARSGGVQSKDARKLAFASPALKQKARTLRALLGGGNRIRIINLEG